MLISCAAIIKIIWRKIFVKYGLIFHFDTHNLGDDIQAYAMERFLPHVDYLIDREHLDSFYTETGEKVAAFLGGWYMHKPLNWPPSPFLKLLPISFHLSAVEGKKILTLMDYGAKWLKKFPRIGCRDKGTLMELKNAKVKGYVSGSFSLTIEPFEDVANHGKIVLTDLSKNVVDFIKKRTINDIVIVSHDNTRPLLPPVVVNFANEHAKEEEIPTSHYPAVLDRAYRGSCYRGNWNFRHALAEGLLRFYQGASLVITSRLNAALPCLALGTPVLFIKDEADLANYKFSSYLSCLNYTTPEVLLAKNYDFDFDAPKANPGGHERFARIIKSACEDFISSCENEEDESKIDVETWLDLHQKNLRLKRILKMFAPGAEPPNQKLVNPKLYKF